MRFDEKKYFNFLKSKNIVLVGPANYLVGKNRGHEIDKYDLIARMNFSVPIKEETKIDLGSRTDILYKRLLNQINKQGDYFPTEKEIRSWKSDELKWAVIIATDGMSKGAKFDKINKIFPWTVTGGVKGQIKKQIKNKRVFAGLISVVHMLKAPIKSLTVTNCTFYDTGYHDNYRGLVGSAASGETDRRDFDILKQLKFLNDLKKKDKRLIFDDYLKNIVKEKL